MTLKYTTSNKSKVDVADRYLKPYGIQVERQKVDLIEIQSDSVEEVSVYKVKQAYDRVKQQLIVNDAQWSFEALNGFPGLYMKYVNDWLTPKNFTDLMEDQKNKTVIYKEAITFTNGKITKTFTETIKGRFLGEKRGSGLPPVCLVSLRNDGKSIAESWELGIDPVDKHRVWEEFAEWYEQNNNKKLVPGTD